MSILNRLTIKNLRLNKKRTIVTIIGIILSTALMVGIGLLFSSFQDLMIRDTIGYNGKYEANYGDVDLNKLNNEISKIVGINVSAVKHSLAGMIVSSGLVSTWAAVINESKKVRSNPFN